MREFGEWLQEVSPSAALPVQGGVTITSEATVDYAGDVAGALFFEAPSLKAALEKARKSPGLKYGWTHDVLQEMGPP